MRLQASKKQLAALLLSPHDGEEANDRLGGLHVSVTDGIICLYGERELLNLTVKQNLKELL